MRETVGGQSADAGRHSDFISSSGKSYHPSPPSQHSSRHLTAHWLQLTHLSDVFIAVKHGDNELCKQCKEISPYRNTHKLSDIFPPGTRGMGILQIIIFVYLFK